MIGTGLQHLPGFLGLLLVAQDAGQGVPGIKQSGIAFGGAAGQFCGLLKPVQVAVDIGATGEQFCIVGRFGQALLDALDRGLGRLADPRTAFRLPERFHAALELPAEVSQTEALLFAARRLLVQLAGFLAARSGGVQRIVVKLVHRQSATEVPIGLVAPSRDWPTCADR